MEKQEHQPFLRHSDDGSSTESEPDVPPRLKSLNRRFAKFAPHILVSVLTSFVWIAILFVVTHVHPKWTFNLLVERPHNVTSGMRYVTCGPTPADAKSQGCIFDPLLTHWVPEPCFDSASKYWLEKYQSDGSWLAYSDPNMTQLLTVEEMSVAPIYYSHYRDHVVHCSTMWQKQFQGLFEMRDVLDSRVTSKAHMDHCVKFFQFSTDEHHKLEHEPVANDGLGMAGCYIRD